LREHDWSKYEAVVHKRWQYYAPRFEKFARGEWLSWNWAAFVATLAWLRYRKLYAWSWAYFFVSTPLLLAVSQMVVLGGDDCERALDPAPSSVIVLMVLPFLFLQWILAPLVANPLYFRHVRTKIGKTKRTTGTGGYIGALALQALMLIGANVAGLGYANYAYHSMADEGVLQAGAAKASLQEYVNEHRGLPARIDEMTGNVSSKYVDRIVLESDGTIRVIFGDTAKKLSGHSVSFVPENKDGRIVDWVCRSNDLPDQCLPSHCRRH
jgi:hypothetical protein